MKSEKAITPMRCVNANPGKYVSIITNFGCHYTCPECIVRNNGLKMSETDNFSTQEPLNKVLCKERPEWVSVSGGGDPLFHWKEHWSFYEGLFHTAERRNVKLEMHTSYLPDSPEVQDFPLNWFERVVYHVHKFDDAEAEKSKVAADAELYVAEKKAEANRALNDSLNSNLLEYYRITNVDSLWNGELPTYVGGDGSIPVINGIN